MIHRVSVTEDATVRIWDVKRGEAVKRLKGHSDEIVQVKIRSDGKIFSASFDGTIRCWVFDSIVGADCTTVLSGQRNWGYSLHLSDDHLISGCTDGTFKLWAFSKEERKKGWRDMEWMKKVGRLKERLPSMERIKDAEKNKEVGTGEKRGPTRLVAKLKEQKDIKTASLRNWTATHIRARSWTAQRGETFGKPNLSASYTNLLETAAAAAAVASASSSGASSLTASDSSTSSSVSSASSSAASSAASSLSASPLSSPLASPREPSLLSSIPEATSTSPPSVISPRWTSYRP
jgi:WD40 repeat protein